MLTYADIRLQMAMLSPCGTAMHGVLACEAANREITIVQGWNWYAGADARAVGATQYDFQTIVTQELGHALVARRYGIPMRGITLFVFGGVAEMDGEPPSGRSEFYMAIAGPAASVIVSVGCLALAAVGRDFSWPYPLRGVLGYLGWVNLVLVAFNLIPAFPLDGGRVLRAGYLQDEVIYTLADGRLMLDLPADGGTLEFGVYDEQAALQEQYRVNSWDEALEKALAPENCDAPGGVLLADTPQGRYLKAQGLASTQEQTPVVPTDSFQIGSNTKSFTTVLALLLRRMAYGLWMIH